MQFNSQFLLESIMIQHKLDSSAFNWYNLSLLSLDHKLQLEIQTRFENMINNKSDKLIYLDI